MIWDAITGDEVLDLGHATDLENQSASSTVFKATFFPDDKRVLILAHGVLQVWDVANGAQLLTLDTNAEVLRKIGGAADGAFSPDGSKLLVSVRDVEIPWRGDERPESGVWNARTGGRIFSLGEGEISDVAYARWREQRLTELKFVTGY